MRVVALLATYDEERFVASAIEQLASQGVEVYMIDNESTDATTEIAERYRDRGLAGIETFARGGVYPWLRLLDRKAELASTLDADWFMHVDADEVRLPPQSGVTLAEAMAEVDRLGYNAVNFREFTFVPTLEQPDHDHSRFQETMRWYYPFLPCFPDQLKAWKRQEQPVDLRSAGGHRVDFPERRIYPESFPMRHYLHLSVEHAIWKYAKRVYDPAEVAAGFHRRRAAFRGDNVNLLSESELREYVSDDLLDASDPRIEHPLFAGVQFDETP